jgi:hypothetical protein
MFAFMPSTRPTYKHWKGEWGLLSLMIVVGMTIGASNTTSFARFLGTIVGASMGFLGWVVSGGDAIPLILFGWLFSLCNFYFILVVKNGPVGRITLLAWNVTVLYAYGLTRGTDENDDDLDDNLNPLMFEIWYHRIISVSLGIVWGMIISRVIWPISGRRKFKEGLAVLYLQMGLIWRRGPLAILLNSHGTSSYLKTGEQAALQRYGVYPELDVLIAPVLRKLTCFNKQLSNWKPFVKQPRTNSNFEAHFPAPRMSALCNLPTAFSTASTPCH